MLNRRGLLAAGAAGLMLPKAARAGGQVIVGTWGGDYANLLAENIDKPLVAPTGVEVLQDVATQDPRKTKLTAERAGRRGTMDVACLSDIDCYAMNLLGVWEPISEANVPNLKNVLPSQRTNYDINQIYSGLVVLYNPDKIPGGLKSFADLWDPKFKGKVGLVDIQYLYNTAMATLVAGGTLKDLEPGKKALMDLKGRVQPKIYPSNEAMAIALKGEEVWITVLWLARGMYWKNGGVPLTHAVPTEGAITYASGAGVPKNAPNKANALAYLNAMLEPAAQQRFAERMFFAPTISNAKVSPELMKNIGFTEAEQAKFNAPDFDYMAKNTSQLLDFWNKEFKA
jgi:putative spermidine/putrescine transport system substrate-binding protein